MSGAKEWTESVDDFNRLQFDDSFPLEEGEEVGVGMIRNLGC